MQKRALPRDPIVGIHHDLIAIAVQVVRRRKVQRSHRRRPQALIGGADRDAHAKPEEQDGRYDAIARSSSGAFPCLHRTLGRGGPVVRPWGGRENGTNKN